jgi:hypothetical protein
MGSTLKHFPLKPEDLRVRLSHCESASVTEMSALPRLRPCRLPQHGVRSSQCAVGGQGKRCLTRRWFLARVGSRWFHLSSVGAPLHRVDGGYRRYRRAWGKVGLINRPRPIIGLDIECSDISNLVEVTDHNLPCRLTGNENGLNGGGLTDCANGTNHNRVDSMTNGGIVLTVGSGSLRCINDIEGDFR